MEDSKEKESPIEAQYEIVSSDEEFKKNSDYDEEDMQFRPVKPMAIWKAKLIIWGIIIGGIILGAVVLVFFAALFVYFFIPIMLLLAGWYLVKRFLIGK